MAGKRPSYVTEVAFFAALGLHLEDTLFRVFESWPGDLPVHRSLSCWCPQRCLRSSVTLQGQEQQAAWCRVSDSVREAGT